MTVVCGQSTLCRKRMSKLASEHNKQTIESCIDDFNASVDLIVQIEKFDAAYRRIITSISSPDPVSGEMHDIVVYDAEKDCWTMHALPERIVKRFDKKLIKRGV